MRTNSQCSTTRMVRWKTILDEECSLVTTQLTVYQKTEQNAEMKNGVRKKKSLCIEKQVDVTVSSGSDVGCDVCT